MTTRLEACIEALKAKKWTMPQSQNDYRDNTVLNYAIDIVISILSAEPTSEEIDTAMEAYSCFTKNGCVESGMKAALKTVFGRKP